MASKWTKLLSIRKTHPVKPVPKIPKKLPEIEYLFSGWFHEDWDLCGSTLEDVIADYLKNPPEHFPKLVDEIDWLRKWLRSLKQPETIHEVLQASGLRHSYWPREGHDKWLARIRKQVAASCPSET